MCRVRVILGFVLIIMMFLGCSNKTTSIRLTNDTTQKISYVNSQVLVKSQNSKILIMIPIKKEMMFSYSYKFPILNIKFSMPIKDLKMPSQFNTEVIEGMKLLDFNTLSIDLRKDVQFIILREKPERLKIILVPKKKEEKEERNVTRNKLNFIKFFKDENNNFYLLLKAQDEFTYKFLKAKKKHLKLLLPDLNIPIRFRKLYNLSKFNSPIKSVLLEQSKEGGILTFYMVQRVPLNVEKGENWIRIEVNNLWMNLVKNQKSKNKKRKTLSGKDHETKMSIILPGMRTQFTGVPISIDLQDADIEHVLRLLSEIGKFNLILDESVKGKISLKLKDTPWDQVLDLIMLQKDLGMVKQGNIVRIAPLKKLKEEQERIVAAREALLKAKKSQEKLAPLKVEYIQINYSTASSIINRLKDFVSKRGKISYDERTNQIIVYDTEEHIKKIKSVIRKLDRPERQVLIEARIVYVTDSFQRSLGIRWGGGMASYATRHGNTIRYGIYGAQGSVDEAFNPSDIPAGFAINLIPEQGLTSGSLGLFVTKMSGRDFFTINAQLTLGESKGLVKTISSPRIVTLNNQKAEVSQGTKIATKTESESGGTTTEYVEATLKLSVTPQITPDNKLILTVEISDDNPVPGGEDIETRKASTKLIVNNEETVVIGGVQKITESETYEGIPGLSRIPLLGWLFKNKTKIKSKNELLIFIRPKIL